MLSFTFPFINSGVWLGSFSNFFFLLSHFHGISKDKKKKERAKFVWATTPWLRIKAAFVLSLIESLLLFIGARQPGQQGRQSYADCIEGLHYLGASYFLFSLKGRVRESISLAGRAMASKRRKGREERACARERESYKGSGSLWDAQASGGGEKKINHTWAVSLHIARRLFASNMKVCDSGLVHLYALMRDIPVCITYTRIYMCNACVRSSLTGSEKKKKPQEALKGFTVYHCIWPNEWWCYIHYSEEHWIINNTWWINNMGLCLILSSFDSACASVFYFF